MLHPRHKWVRGTLMTAGFSCLGLLITSAPASATTLRKMDLPELVSGADRVVHARAVDSTVYWDPSGTQIFTDTSFEVLAEAKGQGPSTLVVTLLGGRIDPVEMREDGAPSFALGDEVVLFALNRPDGKMNVLGFTQGVMRVITDSSGDKIAVSEIPMGVSLVQVTGPQPSVVRPSPMRAPLGILLEDIRLMVSGSGPTGPVISSTPDTDPVAPGDEIQ
jgi:hypothetical protein